MTLHARLMLSGLAVAAFGSLSCMTLPGGAAAQPDPAPGASQRVLDQNLDGNGLIGGHTQGTASVNVTDASLSVTRTITPACFHRRSERLLRGQPLPSVDSCNREGAMKRARPDVEISTDYVTKGHKPATP